jgi:hypothetical protein
MAIAAAAAAKLFADVWSDSNNELLSNLSLSLSLSLPLSLSRARLQKWERRRKSAKNENPEDYSDYGERLRYVINSFELDHGRIFLTRCFFLISLGLLFPRRGGRKLTFSFT